MQKLVSIKSEQLTRTFEVLVLIHIFFVETKYLYNKNFEGSCELLRFDADKLLCLQSYFCSLLYKCTQNQLTVQVYTKPV